jgi:hypothetical protein
MLKHSVPEEELKAFDNDTFEKGFDHLDLPGAKPVNVRPPKKVVQARQDKPSDQQQRQQMMRAVAGGPGGRGGGGRGGRGRGRRDTGFRI